jgi:hypothetical protein
LAQRIYVFTQHCWMSACRAVLVLIMLYRKKATVA